MIQKHGEYKFNKNLAKFKQLQRSVPIEIGNMAKNHFLGAFRQGSMKGGGFTNDSIGGWTPRKRETRLSRGKPILVGTGHLRRSIGVLSKTWSAITIGTRGIPYAAIHNEGGQIAIGAHTSIMSFNSRGRMVRSGRANYQQKVAIRGSSGKMPKREYLGNSNILNKKVKVLLIKKLNQIMT
jgi:phage gpG-like protein